MSSSRSAERPITVELGTNMLLGLDTDRIEEVPQLIRDMTARDARLPPLWDGRAGVRVVDVLERFLEPEAALPAAAPLRQQ